MMQFRSYYGNEPIYIEPDYVVPDTSEEVMKLIREELFRFVKEQPCPL